jgi:hypothetical protein
MVGRPDGLPLPGTDSCRPPRQKLWQLSAAQLAGALSEELGADALLLEQRFARYAQPSQPFSNDPAVLGGSQLFVSELFAAVREATELAFQDPAKLEPCLATAPSSDCIRTLISNRGASAYRRPVTEAETAALVQFFEARVAEVGNLEAAKLVVRRLFGGREFLFRTEWGTVDAQSGMARLSANELADLTAFALTDAPPDGELRAAAATGALLQPAVLEAQVGRLLTSYATSPAVLRFFREWLGVDRTRFQLRPALKDREARVLQWLDEEFNMFLKHVVWEDTGQLHTIFDADYTFWSKTLADHYGLSFRPEDNPKLPTLDGRRGFLMEGAFLTNQAGATARGSFIRKQLLCQTVPEPPPGVETNFQLIEAEAEKQAGAQLSPRAIRAAHMTETRCSGCHSLLDPLGFPFDVYDNVGQIRSEWEGGFPIDTAGEIVGTASTNAKVASAQELVLKLAASPDVQDCFVNQAYAFVQGRYPEPTDSCYLESCVRTFERRLVT